jgi:hypothetical protein
MENIFGWGAYILTVFFDFWIGGWEILLEENQDKNFS